MGRNLIKQYKNPIPTLFPGNAKLALALRQWGGSPFVGAPLL